jgi:FkbM family methyltransferase
MELSYAQNLEDYHLSLVFEGRERGFYVDIGGGHPVADNVSFWFYLRGWRGLVVEPQRALAELYRVIRPRDVAVATLIGDRVGEAEFHRVDRLHGFSSMVERHAEGAAAFGAAFRTERLPITTLAALCEEHRVEGIDFLKVDVEGAEAEVLRGGDWRRFRPKVVLVEAVAPGSMAASHDHWEPLLLDNGYRFAFFDGLNRFYAADDAAELAQRFPAEKAPWDVVRHLYEFGRAPENAAHPDHALARALVEGFLAALPRLDRGLLLNLLRGAPGIRDSEAPEAALAALLGANDATPERLRLALESDRIGAALGRTACCYDGGQLLDD